MDIEKLPFRKEVTAYIVNENKEFIVVFSALANRFCKTPAGGVEENEPSEKAILREIKEELNINIEIIAKSKIKYKWEHAKERIIERNLKFRGSTGEVFLAKINPPNQKIKIQEEEISGYKWIKKEDVDKYFTTDTLKETAKKIFKEFKNYF